MKPYSLDKNHRIGSTPHGFTIQQRCEKDSAHPDGWTAIRWYSDLGDVGPGYARLSTARSNLGLPQACNTAIDRLDRASARFKAATKAYLEATNAK